MNANLGWLLITISALLDAFYNVALKKSKGLTDWNTNILVLFLLLLTIITFKKGLNILPLGVAIAIWSGISIVTTTMLGVFLFKEKLNFMIVFFIGSIIISIIGLHYFSNK